MHIAKPQKTETQKVCVRAKGKGSHNQKMNARVYWEFTLAHNCILKASETTNIHLLLLSIIHGHEFKTTTAQHKSKCKWFSIQE